MAIQLIAALIRHLSRAERPDRHLWGAAAVDEPRALAEHGAAPDPAEPPAEPGLSNARQGDAQEAFDDCREAIGAAEREDRPGRPGSATLEGVVLRGRGWFGVGLVATALVIVTPPAVGSGLETRPSDQPGSSPEE